MKVSQKEGLFHISHLSSLSIEVFLKTVLLPKGRLWISQALNMVLGSSSSSWMLKLPIAALRVVQSNR